jgi:cytochrome bd-type quinol oxidase subunit 2
MVAFESVKIFFHFLHLLGGITTVAVCVHLLVRTLRLVSTGNHWAQQVRLHALTLLIAYAVTFACGAIIYPTFRVRVRAEFMDHTMPWVTGLFEIKEHAASIMLFPVLGIFILSRVVDLREKPDRVYASLFIGLIALVLTVVVFNAGVGWYLGAVRSS